MDLPDLQDKLHAPAYAPVLSGRHPLRQALLNKAILELDAHDNRMPVWVAAGRILTSTHTTSLRPTQPSQPAPWASTKRTSPSWLAIPTPANERIASGTRVVFPTDQLLLPLIRFRHSLKRLTTRRLAVASAADYGLTNSRSNTHRHGLRATASQPRGRPRACGLVSPLRDPAMHIPPLNHVKSLFTDLYSSSNSLAVSRPRPCASVGARQVTNLRVAIDRPIPDHFPGHTSHHCFSRLRLGPRPRPPAPSLTKGQTVKVTGRFDTRTSSHTGLTYTHVVTDHIELMPPEIPPTGCLSPDRRDDKGALPGKTQ